MRKINFKCQKLMLSAVLIVGSANLSLAEQPVETFRGTSVEDVGSEILESVRGVVRSSTIIRMSSDQLMTVKSFDLHAGDLVDKSQLLLSFDCERERILLKKAKAEYGASRVYYTSAKKMFDYGQAGRASADAARLEMEGKAASIDQVKETLSRCNVKAPFYGRVAEVHINEGEMARPGEPLFSLERLDQLELVFIVPSSLLSHIVVGTRVHIDIEEINKTLTAEVTQQLPVIDPVSQSSRIIAKLSEVPQDLRPGMSGKVSFKSVEVSAQ